jgi:fatty acid desaturase
LQKVAISNYLDPAAWVGHGLLRIRTFLEHRAHEAARARTVIIEDRGPLSVLFLNNNFHAVHHMHPAVPWYRLPAVYRANRAHYLRRSCDRAACRSDRFNPCLPVGGALATLPPRGAIEVQYF